MKVLNINIASFKKMKQWVSYNFIGLKYIYIKISYKVKDNSLENTI